jgi:hypothetical protein
MNLLKGIIRKEKGSVVSDSTIIYNMQYKYDDRIKKVVTTDLKTGKKEFENFPPGFNLKKYRIYLQAVIESYRPEFTI